MAQGQSLQSIITWYDICYLTWQFSLDLVPGGPHFSWSVQLPWMVMAVLLGMAIGQGDFFQPRRLKYDSFGKAILSHGANGFF